MIQSALVGDEASEYNRPETFLWCDETEQWVLRSRRTQWPHELFESPEAAVKANEDTIHTSVTVDDDKEDEPMEVGGIYEITLSYSVDYRFSVPASCESVALDRAKNLKFDTHPSSSHHVHTNKRKTKTLYEDDALVPDDWDPYGSTPLWMAIDEAEEDEVDD